MLHREMNTPVEVRRRPRAVRGCGEGPPRRVPGPGAPPARQIRFLLAWAREEALEEQLADSQVPLEGAAVTVDDQGGHHLDDEVRAHRDLSREIAQRSSLTQIPTPHREPRIGHPLRQAWGGALTWTCALLLALAGLAGCPTVPQPSEPRPIDLDGDGSPADLDCDDQDPLRFPGNAEACDGVDNDCDGVVPDDEVDEDLDEELACFDCDDTLNWMNHQDDDEDGFSPCDGDCLDWWPLAHPGADEDPCDGYDTDCDGSMSDDELDQDGDGQRACEGDCDDLDPTVDTLDLDGDGVTGCDGDCLDINPAVHPGLEEVCDGWDNDCDGTRDDVPFTGSFPTGEVLLEDVVWATLYGEVDGDNAGYWMTGLGDMNGDGYGDIAVATSPFSDRAPGRAARVHIVYGPVCGEASLAMEPVGVSGAEVLGWGDVSYVGDVNGDGYDDLHMSGAIFFGPLEGTLSYSTDWDIAFVNWDQWERKFPIVHGPDLNGDGIADMAVGDVRGHPLGRVAIFYGPFAAGVYDLDAPDALLVGPASTFSTRFGFSFASPGDLDGDGFADLVVGAFFANEGGAAEPWYGSAYVFAGPFVGTRTADEAEGVIRGTIPGGRFGRIVEAVGDMDGDGVPEFAVAAPGPFSSSNAALYVFGGAATGEGAATDNLLSFDQWTDGSRRTVAVGTGFATPESPQIAVADSLWPVQASTDSGRVTILGIDGPEATLVGGFPANRASASSDLDGNGSLDLIVAGGGEDHLAAGGVRVILANGPPDGARQKDRSDHGPLTR